MCPYIAPMSRLSPYFGGSGGKWDSWWTGPPFAVAAGDVTVTALPMSSSATDQRESNGNANAGSVYVVFEHEPIPPWVSP